MLQVLNFDVDIIFPSTLSYLWKFKHKWVKLVNFSKAFDNKDIF